MASRAPRAVSSSSSEKMRGRSKEANVRMRTHFAASANDHRSLFRDLQEAAGCTRSASPLPTDCLLHFVRILRSDHLIFDTPVGHRSFLLGGLCHLDSLRVSLPPLRT